MAGFRERLGGAMKMLKSILAGATTWAACVAAAAAVDSVEAVHMPGRGDGWVVSGDIIQDKEGNLYALVENSNKGVLIDRYTRGCGMVFRIDAVTGKRTTLHDFSRHKHSQGCRVRGGLSAHGGWLYGVTVAGGWNNHGTVYRLSHKGHQLLHRFDGANGSIPGDGLTLGSDGQLYGITTAGGVHEAGTVFRITRTGRFESLHSFDPEGGVGSRPNWRLTVGPDGALYGVAYGGGGDTIYRVGLDGAVSLVRRLQPRDGCLPQALTLGSDGWLYGAALICGQYGRGTLYRVQPDGRFERLHAFSGADVGMPKDQLIEGPDGTWYGIAIGDAGDPPKTVYKIRFDGSAPVPLHVFDGARRAGYPSGRLLLATDGLLYGASSNGGNFKGPDGQGSGMVYRLAP
jgi:uncharacterized repeat protein (TIGR03803 family)